MRPVETGRVRVGDEGGVGYKNYLHSDRTVVRLNTL